MTRQAPPLRALPLVPAASFVLVWSSGYIAGPWGVEAMSPLALVAARFLVAAAVVGAVARVLRGPLRVDRGTAWRIAATGFVMNGLQFAAMYLAFDAGLGATFASLLHSLSPLLTAVLAGLLLGERLGGRQLVGFALGVVGVVVVLGPDIDGVGGPAGLALALASLLALSLGTLGQRWIGHAPDPLWSATIQFAVSGPPVLLLALLVEGADPVADPAQALVAIGYLAVVNSVVGLVLLGALVRAAGAGAAASVFFLMPPVTAVMAWLLLGDTLSARELVGLVVAVSGVAIATVRVAAAGR